MDLERNYSDERQTPRPRIGIMGAVLAVLGTASAFLAHAQWDAIFSQEGAAVAGATVGLMGAIVVFARAVQTLLEKKRND